MPQLTTHVLDAVTGKPAQGLAIALAAPGDVPLASAVTDSDGRAAIGPERLEPGDYSLRFETGDWFAAHRVEAFYPFVTVTFRVTGDRHLHVPILLSPFAYSTYRGS